MGATNDSGEPLNRLSCILLAALAVIPFVQLLPGCTFDPQPAIGFEEGDPPLTSGIFCDIEVDRRRCATANDIMVGIDLSKPFEEGFFVNKSSRIGLIHSYEALVECGGPAAVVFQDPFPNGTSVCMNPATVPGTYATTDDACQAWCFEQDFTDADGNALRCGDAARRSNGVPDASAFPNACTPAGALRADFQDPRKIRPVTPVAWTAAVGVTVSGSDLTKTAGMGWGSADPAFSAGAISAQRLNSGDGAVLITASETSSLRIFGLGNGNASASFEDLEYGLLLTQAGTLIVIESGAVRQTVGAYATGDTLEVAVQNGLVVYKKNNVLLFTSTVPPTYPLLVDAALNFTGATITVARVTF